MSKYQIVAVKWLDAHGDNGWSSPEDLDPDPYEVTSVGLELCSKKGHVSIAQSIGVDVYDHVLHIPAGMVKEIFVLGVLDIEAE